MDILYVREINKHLDMTLVPHSPDYVRGLVNLRGQIVTVLDLQKRLRAKPCQLTENSCNLILKTDHELASIRQRENRPDLKTISDTVGLLIDEIDEIVTIDVSEIDPPPHNVGEVEGKYLDGVVKLENQLLAVLSVDQLLKME